MPIKGLLKSLENRRAKRAKKQHERQARALLADVIAKLGPDDLCVDCGANVGAITQQFTDTGAKVVAYEPDPGVFQLLSAKFDAHPKVALHQAAVGVKAGEAQMFVSPNYKTDPVGESVKNTILTDALTRSGEGDMIAVEDAPFEMIKVVNIITELEKLIAAHGRIAILKLDVEGAEIDILPELERHNMFDKIDFAIVEMHPWRFPDRQEEIAELRRSLAAKHPPERLNLDWI